LGFKFLKFSYSKRYFNFSNPIDFIVGIIEFLSEISKILSFSFRLFGNIFAGEMLLVVITSLTIGIATLPFYALELFVGVIQAFVFFMLTAVFISVATAEHH
jgi:F-type H+-transporting ATPase subunit a